MNRTLRLETTRIRLGECSLIVLDAETAPGHGIERDLTAIHLASKNPPMRW